MKSLLQIGVLAVLVYLAYKYYQKNYTKEGKQDSLRDQANLDALVQQKAKELKEQYLQERYSACDTIMSPFGSYSTALAREGCKASALQEAELTDWIAEAQSYFI